MRISMGVRVCVIVSLPTSAEYIKNEISSIIYARCCISEPTPASISSVCMRVLLHVIDGICADLAEASPQFTALSCLLCINLLNRAKTLLQKSQHDRPMPTHRFGTQGGAQRGHHQRSTMHIYSKFKQKCLFVLRLLSSWCIANMISDIHKISPHCVLSSIIQLVVGR